VAQNNDEYRGGHSALKSPFSAWSANLLTDFLIKSLSL